MTYSKLLTKRTSSQALSDLAAGVPLPINKSFDVDVDEESNGTPALSIIEPFTDQKRRKLDEV
jgi:hypothetical protein